MAEELPELVMLYGTELVVLGDAGLDGKAPDTPGVPGGEGNGRRCACRNTDQPYTFDAKRIQQCSRHIGLLAYASPDRERRTQVPRPRPREETEPEPGEMIEEGKDLVVASRGAVQADNDRSVIITTHCVLNRTLHRLRDIAPAAASSACRSCFHE